MSATRIKRSLAKLRIQTEEERELFAASVKIDLAAAVKHLRDGTSYIDDHHRQQYADLMEAQAKLIAWLIASRASAFTPAERS